MVSDYDMKFEEMKKYIPFLENMIRRLESTSSSSTNPRQAQLDKIRSLRDLLLDKKKRMKMENLLKCEQVLINLHAKVERDTLLGMQRDALTEIEQRDTLPGIKKLSEPLFPSNASTKGDQEDLHSARNKLKVIAAKKSPDIDPNTLLEIAPACETEVVCTPGSKEPALFQRRPNKNSLSPPSGKSSNDKKNLAPKRSYTRVLVSPEPENSRSSRRWNTTDGLSSDKPLFSRRSPRRSPKRSPKMVSPSEKKDKKKSNKTPKSKPKDLDIILNVPEDSLNSLRTGDILSRIITCPDDDVDIDTLRDLRKQILGELKQTGANDDISDLILKSYKTKRKDKKKNKEIEEGELSDSESEAIKNVYGNLVVVENDKTKPGRKNSDSNDKEKQAKIQICLVINSEKGETFQNNEVIGVNDFQMFDIEEKNSSENDIDGKKTGTSDKTNKLFDTIDLEEDDKDIKNKECKDSDSSYIEISSSDTESQTPVSEKPEKEFDIVSASFIPNFYNAVNDTKDSDKIVPTLVASKNFTSSSISENIESAISLSENVVKSSENLDGVKDDSMEPSSTIEAIVESSSLLRINEVPKNPSSDSSSRPDTSEKQKEKDGKETDHYKLKVNVETIPLLNTQSEKSKENIKTTAVSNTESKTPKAKVETIPLLNTQSNELESPTKKVTEAVVSEIDILQALKNDILSESIAIPGTEVATPLLHQPKITKVDSAKAIETKKRISIEKYKEKSSVAPKAHLFLNDHKMSKPSENTKKSSLKLTEEEQQRFNFLSLHLEDSSDDETDINKSVHDNIYNNLAPKSPENKDKMTSGSSEPIIIPVDPVKSTVENTKADTDMRTLIPTPNVNTLPPTPNARTLLPTPNVPQPIPVPIALAGIFPQLMAIKNLSDHGSDSRKEKQPDCKLAPLIDPRVRRDVNQSFTKDSPNPHGTNPERTPRHSGNFLNATPNRPFEMTPSRQQVEYDDINNRKHVYAPFPAYEPTPDRREQSVNRDVPSSRWEPNTNPVTESRNSRWDPWKENDVRDANQSRIWDDRDNRRRSSRDGPDYSKSRYDSDRTDGYSRERDSYSRIDCPRTPVHHFGRSDCPSTPIHPFGRSEVPVTPSHPFGRSEAPLTPSHPFGRSDAPMTPSHPFGRSEAPMTPNHPFGRSEAPMTPSHPFGRSEAPLLPSHHFGRTEAPIIPNHHFGRPDSSAPPMTPGHHFGRSDYQHTSAPKGMKDPRLNRNSESESNFRNLDNREKSHYYDRHRPDAPRSETYRSYRERKERGVFEQTARHNRERTPGRDRDDGRNVPREYEKSHSYTRDRDSNGRSNDYHCDVRKEFRSYSEVGERRFDRSQSVGRERPSGSCIDGNYNKLNRENTLSVTSKSGRSFTIDTSVNSTFQEFLNGKGLKIFDHSFESRSRRAASVGRTLTRETSVGRNIREGSMGRTRAMPYSAAEDSLGYKRMVNFVRARSMCRDLVDVSGKSFQEVKADLRSYKNPEITGSKLNLKDPRNQKEQTDKKRSPKSSKNTSYSPRKNYRDPRMNRDHSERNKSKHEDRKKTFGIIYSSDNIAKGTVLGSGYGVKNYKIPKIKKPVEVTAGKEEPKQSKLNKDDRLAVGGKICNENKTKETENHKKVTEKTQKINIDAKNDRDTVKRLEAKGKTSKKSKVESIPPSECKETRSDKTNKRLTRRSKLREEPDKEIKSNLRKPRKSIIESDSETESPETLIPVQPTETHADLIKEGTENIDENNTTDKMENNELNNSFGIDDLEIFSENNPALDNINDLIANLENDIDTTKAEEFNKDISFDNIFENIDSPEENINESLKDITDVIQKLDSSSEPSEVNQNSVIKEKCVDIDNETLPILQSNDNPKVDSVFNTLNDSTCKSPPKNGDVQNNNGTEDRSGVQISISESQSIVTTSDTGKSAKTIEDRCSTPDSTLDASPTVVSNKCNVDGDLPDSTNEKNVIQSADSSTRDQFEPSVKDDEKSFQKENINSFGNILSILQDKSKIKELLSMLGDNQSGDTEKLKKKLEKLSEIVSDDDNSNDGHETHESEKNKHEAISEKETPKHLEVSQEIDSENIRSEKPEAAKLEVQIEAYIVDCKKLQSNDLKDNVVATDDSAVSIAPKSNEPVHPDANLGDSIEEKNITSIEKDTKTVNTKGKLGKNKKVPLRRKNGKWTNKKAMPPGKRITRSGAAANLSAVKCKKPSRELRQLQESIKEMFIKDDILNATGIRMCRLAKLVDDKSKNQDDESSASVEPKPLVVIEKFNEDKLEDKQKELNVRRKPGPKPKTKQSPLKEDDNEEKLKDLKPDVTPKYKPGPKSKTRKLQSDSDPYSFEDSTSEATITRTSELENESDTGDDSASSKSFGSSEALAELKKKPKRKRGGWQSGIIKKRRKKNEPKQEGPLNDDSSLLFNKEVTIPDMSCFTDKSYCFFKNISEYPCRLCEFKGPEIVKHYKTDHPHTEIPLSRMSPVVAREAVEQCEDVNFQAISKIPSERYICRFCFHEFGGKKTVLEEFFWHVVSMHTGEYRRTCSDCVNVTRCPFNLDIPPPPKDVKGQLIGYICGKCNFTQISLENLKTHVIVRHNDEQTAVYTINLGVMSKKSMQALMKRSNVKEQARILRSSRSNPSLIETDPSASDFTNDDDCDNDASKKHKNDSLSKIPVHTKLSFEANSDIKIEKDDNDVQGTLEEPSADVSDLRINDESQASTDIVDISHFKMCSTSSGSKEYVCCVNGQDNHYKTHLLISMKRHVQTKHSEIWDGYCAMCKVIVMPQGEHHFKDCLQHMLDNHLDNFPILEISPENAPQQPLLDNVAQRSTSPNSYINVRSMTELLTPNISPAKTDSLPKIESVISLGTTNETVHPQIAEISEATTSLIKSSICVEKAVPKPEKPYKYEEMQDEVMAQKHVVILQSMLTEDKLVQIFKCAGRYCSFTTDSADAALLHASTHERLGGENSLLCSYCDYDCNSNAIDLVMHVFKIHGCCPFVCGQCFYRAIASQLVFAHIRRVHKSDGGKILTTATVTSAVDTGNMIPREVAVQHYVCIENNDVCKFKTYTSGKYIDHLVQKHKSPFNCQNCSQVFESETDLIVHLRTHGLKLYQCTWCLEGGDNEADFLSHSSERHPNREPQAYLRLITLNTNKDGVSKTMVLPLVKLNKSSLPTHPISSQGSAADPAKEAEKALDMEKFIKMPLPQSNDTTPTQVIQSQLSSELASAVLTVPTEEPRIETPPPSTSVQVQLDTEATLTPILKVKTERTEDNSEKNKAADLIICLDSDEEDVTESTNKKNVTGLPADEGDQRLSINSEQLKKFTTLAELFRCARCNGTYKSASGFKRHISAPTCFDGQGEYRCAHCKFTTNESVKLFNHYTSDHDAYPSSSRDPNYVCGVCNRTDKSLPSIKKHIKKEHGISNVNVISVPEEDELSRFVVVAAPTRGRPGPKRKLSGNALPDIAPKRVRYGVQDLHNLPQKQILDDLAYCSECEFSTKVRVNLIRHIQQHAQNQSVPQTAPVNPVPHLETNEKHFDRMINLASSSLELARIEKTPTLMQMSAEAAARYPKFVPDRQRHTCGAKGCTYISLDEAMLKCHWETLHAGSNDFHCVHCPPYQSLDTSIPLSASRIIAHLKMHDVRLYACSLCSYYHYRKQVVEKHLADIHKGSGQVVIVREESTNAASTLAAPQSTNAAPTMDLKPWKCGLCSFKSMLRPEVVDHCSKTHNTKMQFKCPVCPFRGSSLENVSKHHKNSHPESTEEVFYYYYREGTIPDEPDGTPRWVKQRQKVGNPEPESEVKSESVTAQPATSLPLQPILPAIPKVDLNIVKEEIIDPELDGPSQSSNQRFGDICDPNGLKYKCPLCKTVTEDKREAMQSHLYEELKYRKWACSICCYKAFHKTGLHEHMITEHRQHRSVEPVELPANTQVEQWVAKVLDHQHSLIESSRANLAIQKLPVERSAAKTAEKAIDIATAEIYDVEKLVACFGEFRTPVDTFSCPKCSYTTEDEGAIKDHLEIELNKIRWRCNVCGENAQNYHEAQLHSKTCKMGQPGQSPRPVEAVRDPAVRAAWVAAVIHAQKLAMKKTDGSAPQPEGDDMEPPENSLLVVRYEERVPTPEVEMVKRKRPAAPPAPTARAHTPAPAPAAATAPAPAPSPDSDDERLVIDEPTTDGETPKKKDLLKKCTYCSYTTKYRQQLEHHILRHFNLKPLTCSYCEETFFNTTIENHTLINHPDLPKRYTKTLPPSGPPIVPDLPKHAKKKRRSDSSSNEDSEGKKNKEVKRDDIERLICLVCEKEVAKNETADHVHDRQTYFAKKGEVVVKCCICLSLLPNIDILQEHNGQVHPSVPVNYAYFKLSRQTREILQCGHCSKRFKFFRDLKIHHKATHTTLPLKYESRPYNPSSSDFEINVDIRGETSKNMGQEETSSS